MISATQLESTKTEKKKTLWTMEKLLKLISPVEQKHAKYPNIWISVTGLLPIY